MNINVKLHEDFTSEIVEKFWTYLKKLHKEIQESEQYGMAEFYTALGFIYGLKAARLLDTPQVLSLSQICCDVLEDGRKDVPQITDFSITRERIRLVIDG